MKMNEYILERKIELCHWFEFHIKKREESGIMSMGTKGITVVEGLLCMYKALSPVLSTADRRQYVHDVDMSQWTDDTIL